MAEGKEFFRRYWAETRAIADASKRFYVAFGVGQGGKRQMFGPGVWLAGARAALKGHTASRAAGDPWTMPGLFLVKGEAILWRHAFRHAGDHPDFARLPDVLRALG